MANPSTDASSRMVAPPAGDAKAADMIGERGHACVLQELEPMGKNMNARHHVACLMHGGK